MATTADSIAVSPSLHDPHVVLLVDDQAITGILLGKMLTAEPDLRLVACQRAGDALWMAEEREPDVILLDLVMPETDGLTLLAEFRRRERFAHVPILMLSTQEEPQVKATAFALGANDYLIKLPDAREMVARLRYHAESHRNFHDLMDKEREVRDIARRFQIITRSVQDAIITVDVRDGVAFWNQAAERLFGYAEAEALAMPVTNLLAPSCRERFQLAVSSLFDQREGGRTAEFTAQRKQGSISLEFLAQRRNDEEFPVEISLSRMEDNPRDCYVAVMRDITERKEAEERIHYQANFDALTCLPNRPHFMERLEHNMVLAQRQQTGLCLMFIDLDRFKWVNDTLGHAAGDELLRETARRLKECVRKSDTVGRLGGDEFTVILYGLNRKEGAAQMAERILAALATPYHLENQRVTISGSIGITFFPDDAADMEGLLRNADMAMYVAKNSGKNAYWFFRVEA